MTMTSSAVQTRVAQFSDVQYHMADPIDFPSLPVDRIFETPSASNAIQNLRQSQFGPALDQLRTLTVQRTVAHPDLIKNLCLLAIGAFNYSKNPPQFTKTETYTSCCCCKSDRDVPDFVRTHNFSIGLKIEAADACLLYTSDAADD